MGIGILHVYMRHGKTKTYIHFFSIVINNSHATLILDHTFNFVIYRVWSRQYKLQNEPYLSTKNEVNPSKPRRSSTTTIITFMH